MTLFIFAIVVVIDREHHQFQSELEAQKSKVLSLESRISELKTQNASLQKDKDAATKKNEALQVLMSFPFYLEQKIIWVLLQ